MGSMPIYNISKGPFADLDARFDGTIKQNYHDALDTLNTTDLLTATQQRYGATNKKTQHFEDDWLGSANNPAKYNWSNLRIDDTLKWGLIQAIETALQTDPPKPMEFFWVCANDHSFHIYFHDGPHQVTVMIFTPPPLVGVNGNPNANGFRDPADLTTPENLFVVKKYEVSDAGTYPSPITILYPPDPASPPEIIMREIFR
jgi:hypothetical protein